MIDATDLKARRTVISMAVKKGGRGHLIGQTNGGVNTKLDSVTDSVGRPIHFFISAASSAITRAQGTGKPTANG